MRKGTHERAKPQSLTLGGERERGFKQNTTKKSQANFSPDCAPVEPRATGAALPCLFSNNSIGEPPPPPDETRASQGSSTLSTQQKKSACALAWNVQAMAEKYGLNYLGFFTLTFADDVQCPREAQRRFNSLKANVLSDRYVDYIRVWERTKKGRLHCHMVVVLKDDIRTGFSFSGIANGDYSSANAYLRSEWAFWRANAKKYGFGRTELLPIRSTAEGIARYVGKYISKHMKQREERDKGARLVEYTRGARVYSTRYAFVTKGSHQWRQKLAMFAYITGYEQGLGRSARFEELSELLGKRWAYKNREFILSLPAEDMDEEIKSLIRSKYDDDDAQFDPLDGLNVDREAFYESEAIRLAASYDQPDPPPDDYFDIPY